MITNTFTMVANTPQQALTGRYVIRQVVYTAAAAGTLTVYDAASTTLTQSNAAYTKKARTNPYTRTTTAVRDVLDNSNDYTHTGISDLPATNAANSTYPLPALDTIGVPAAGQAIADNRLVVTRGLVLNSTATATVQVTYESVP